MALQNQFGNLSLDASTLAVRDVLSTGVTHADLTAILAKLGAQDPDGTLQVSDDSKALFFDAFDGALTNFTTGGTAPAISGGMLSFASSTSASGSSYLRTNGTFMLRPQAYLRAGFFVQLGETTTAITNSTRWWGYGQNQSTPTAANPVLNGPVFVVDYADGALYGATYSAGTRTQRVALSRPTDGALHKYEVWFRQAVVYFLIDGVTVGSINLPNTAVTSNMYVVSGSVNHTTAPGTAPVLRLSSASMADTSGTVGTLGDGDYPWIQASVRTSSSAAASTDKALVTVLRDVPTVNVVRAPSTPAARGSAGGATAPMVDTEGKTVIAGTGDSAQSWQGNVTQASTTAAAIKAAGASGVRNYLTDLSVSNSSTTATVVQVLDGSTVIWQQTLPAGGSIHRSFNTPLRGTAATAMNVNMATAVSSVYFSATGYVGV